MDTAENDYCKVTVFAILTANGTRLKKFLKSCFGAKFDINFRS